MNPIVLYHREIESGKATVSRKIKRTYQKVINDLENPGRWHYDEKRANHAIDFIETFCRHVKGELGGQKIKLELWQKAMIATAFGFIDAEGYRKYRRVILIIGKKNGKSLLASAIGLYLQLADGERGPEVVSAATTRQQAKIIWGTARAMVKMDPHLRQINRPYVSELSSEEYNFGSFVPLSRDHWNQDGPNLHGVLLDEVQQWRNGIELYDLLARGTSARNQPLILITTTAGTVREDIFDFLYEEAELIINGYDDGNYTEENTLPLIYELDKRKEWTNPKAWPKANPGLGTIKNYEFLATEVEKAKKSPLLVKNLLCKDFNVRETVGEAWLTFEELNNQAEYKLEEMGARYGIGGVDLSSTTDLTNATVIFKVPDDDTIYVLQKYWMPEELMERREREDKVPYALWRKQGFIDVTPGNKIHYKFVVEWFLKVQKELDIYLPYIGYDSWSATYFVEEMKGFFGETSMIPVIQGKKTLSIPMQRAGADLAAKKINYNNNPVLKWCLSNVVADVDKNGNIQPVKGKNQRRRIDGFAGLLNAYVVLEDKYEIYMSLI